MNTIINFIQINEQIATAGQPSKEQFKNIKENSFNIIINLALHNSDNAIKEEDYIVSALGMDYIHLPISWKNPEVHKLKLFLHILKTLQKQNKKVFIHCVKNYRVSVFMHHYKKTILKQNTSFIAPKDYVPNETWKKFLEQKILP